MLRAPLRALLTLGVPVILMLAALSPQAIAQQRTYRIALTYPYPPWDVGPLQGVDFDLLSAICRANGPMRCSLEARASSDCVDTNMNSQMVIGPALASGAVDGCVAWYVTDARKQLGGEFSDAYSFGSTPQLIAADGNVAFDDLGTEGSLGGAHVGFIAGFFNDNQCLSGHYSDFSASFFSSEQTGRDTMVSELLGGQLDLAFWDNVATIPAGTHPVGSGITGCGPLLALMTFPPSVRRPHQADELRRDFNCGLALIRATGEMAAICAASSYPGGDPNCVLEGPAPTVQCLAENPGAPAGTRAR